MVDTKSNWPPLPLAEWADTYATLHMWTQVVGKIRLTLTPPVNHWWHVTLLTTARGLTTSPMPYGHGTLEIAFDFIDHRLLFETSDGRRRSLNLEPKSVADFYREVMRTLAELEMPRSHLADAGGSAVAHPVRPGRAASFVRSGVGRALVAGASCRSTRS